MTGSEKDVLIIKDLSFCYSGSKSWVLDEVNLEIKRGERLALIGSSGSGKSTIARILLQIIPPESICRGEIFIDGNDLMNMEIKSLEKLRGELVGLVFQDPGTRLNPLMTVGAHLIDTLREHRPHKTSFWVRSKAEELLEKVGINIERFDSYPHEFSGGMRQRVAIALAIALNPPLIIADEPTSSLDVTIANQIMGGLSSLCNDLGISLLLISHDLALASKWCDRIAILDSGRIVEEKLNHQLFANPSSFLGKKLVEAVKAREGKTLTFQPQQDVILEVNRLRCWFSASSLPWQFKWIKTIDEISFSLNFGETLGIVGISGCGKSTLCRALLGLIPIRGGEVTLLGKNLGHLNKKDLKIIRRSVQMVFQDPFTSLNPRMTVCEAISDPLLIHGLANVTSAKEQVRHLLEQVGLMPEEDFPERFPHQLSGGQQQRVAIARALALNPKILICDESVSMLDVEIQADILKLLRGLQEKLGLAIIFVTHDLSVASSFCHRIIVLDQGKIVEEGQADLIISNPQAALTKELVSISPRII